MVNITDTNHFVTETTKVVVFFWQLLCSSNDSGVQALTAILALFILPNITQVGDMDITFCQVRQYIDLLQTLGSYMILYAATLECLSSSAETMDTSLS